MKITPGDEITASATVHGHDVTLRIRDLSTGARFSITRRSSAVDLSSAEWIVEAPLVCRASDSCSTLPLTNFGTVLFSGAYATAAAHTGTITDQAWSDEAIELREGELIAPGGAGRRQGPERVLLTAAPTTRRRPAAPSASPTANARVGAGRCSCRHSRDSTPPEPGTAGVPGHRYDAPMVLYTCPARTHGASAPIIKHPCGVAAQALDRSGLAYEVKVVGGFKNVPFSRRGKRSEILE